MADDGTMTVILPESAVGSIDAWDAAVSTVGYQAMRAGLASHAAQRSLETAQAQVAPGQTVVPAETPYRVDGAAGRFTFTTHRVMAGSRVVYDTARDLFPPLGPKEWYETRGYKERALFHGVVDLSLRKTCQQLDLWRHQPKSASPRTLQDTVEAEGRVVQAALKRKASTALEQAGFSPAAQPLHPGEPSGITACLPPETVAPALAALKQQPDMAARITPEIEAEIRQNPVPYENPAHTVNISADDVGAV